ncbi:MAG: 4-hydroxy-tetrahydrodipicolinate synthase [Kiritimatiellaeota bacterium]|nr:4-hydroxy-tetrahydrodipicolinate synthase [Kiritimatiellota bacterium]
MKLAGVFTAMVTPFDNGSVDFGKIGELVKMQLEGGIDGLVPVGTTGESPTLAMDEHVKVIETVVNAAGGNCLVIAGTGANSTAEAVELTNIAKSIGADATLQVTPYYNKPPQEGLYRHFSTVADECGLPVVLYNVPGRSGVPIAIPTIAKLASNPNIICVKEAGGSADRVSQILDACDITVLSGDDSLTLPMMSIGATGIISVASNLLPARVKAMVAAFSAGDAAKAMELHRELYPFFRDIFIETNPVPIKAAMARKNLIKEEYRLPLCPISAANMEILATTMDAVGI